jgi:hypothetical protein
MPGTAVKLVLAEMVPGRLSRSLRFARTHAHSMTQPVSPYDVAAESGFRTDSCADNAATPYCRCARPFGRWPKKRLVGGREGPFPEGGGRPLPPSIRHSRPARFLDGSTGRCLILRASTRWLAETSEPPTARRRFAPDNPQLHARPWASVFTARREPYGDPMPVRRRFHTTCVLVSLAGWAICERRSRSYVRRAGLGTAEVRQAPCRVPAPRQPAPVTRRDSPTRVTAWAGREGPFAGGVPSPLSVDPTPSPGPFSVSPTCGADVCASADRLDFPDPGVDLVVEAVHRDHGADPVQRATVDVGNRRIL